MEEVATGVVAETNTCPSPQKQVWVMVFEPVYGAGFVWTGLKNFAALNSKYA